MSNLPLIDRLSRHACRGSGMGDADADDFCSSVRLALLDDDYAVLRQFEKRCSLATYLVLVIRRLLLDFRGRLWGRFCTSADAQRLGPVAVALEELLHRHGKTLDEAVAELRRRGQTIDGAEANRLTGLLPRRIKRMHVGLDDAPESRLVARESAEQSLIARERDELALRLAAALRVALDGLAPEDQTLLRLHFVVGVSVADISRSMAADQQLLYRRIRALCRELRQALLAAGIERSRIQELLGDRELDLGLIREDALSPGPSTTVMAPMRKTGGQHDE